eukprot:5130302-Pyramimonas_sp.AAC.1
MIAEFLIRCKYQGTVSNDLFIANVATGSGKNLPAILGLASMEQKKVIFILEEGKQAMIMPGGDYRIHVGPEAVVANL